ncbi:HAD hydrolase-like protein [Siminovitchia terrae]
MENGEETLIVSDSLADLLAAKEMGCRIAAVLKIQKNLIIRVW